MEIQQLKGFLAVARFNNFTIAAQKTHRTQPTISLQVKALEEELGVKLFERLGPKKVRLTAEGRILQDLVASVVEDLENVKTRFDEARGVFSRSSVKIVTQRSVMVSLLPNIIKRFKQVYPECQITVLNRSREEILRLLEEGEADVGITSSVTNIPPNLNYRAFARFNRILIATKKHPISEQKNITIEELAKYPLILPARESHTRKIIDRLFAEKGLNYDLTMEVVGRDAIKTYVGMNLGISIITDYYISPADKKTLFVKNLSRLLGKSEMGVLTRKGKFLSDPVREFINLILSQKHDEV